MNEPPNPPEANQPPSDSTPPPPPPPPFTPPPASTPPPPAAPGPTPTAVPTPHPPIYTPPPGAPAKKSAMPWILGGCGCLTLIAIIAGILVFMAYRAKQKVTEFKSDFKSSLKSLDDASQALIDPNSVPKEEWERLHKHERQSASLPPGEIHRVPVHVIRRPSRSNRNRTLTS